MSVWWQETLISALVALVFGFLGSFLMGFYWRSRK